MSKTAKTDSTATRISETALVDFTCNIDSMLETYITEKKEYIAPKRKELGVITVPVIREIIAPAVFKQDEPEPITASIFDEEHVRAIANKFKYGERARLLQLLRSIGLGGAMPQNRSAVSKKDKAGDVFDACTYILGDSGMHDNRPLSVRASASYSCALSTVPERECVDNTFHVRSNERGTLFDEVDKKSSDNLFNRFFVQPGTLMLQVITFTGKAIPPELLEMYLAVLGSPFMAGGQTSIYGVNVKTHVVGAFGGLFEKSMNSPYELLKQVIQDAPDSVSDPQALSQAVFNIMSKAYGVSLKAQDVKVIQDQALDTIEGGEIPAGWQQASEQVSKYFTEYFH